MAETYLVYTREAFSDTRGMSSAEFSRLFQTWKLGTVQANSFEEAVAEAKRQWPGQVGWVGHQHARPMRVKSGSEFVRVGKTPDGAETWRKAPRESVGRRVTVNGKLGTVTAESLDADSTTVRFDDGTMRVCSTNDVMPAKEPRR